MASAAAGPLDRPPASPSPANQTHGNSAPVQRLLLIRTRSEADRTAIVRIGTVLHDYGSFVAVSAPSAKPSGSREGLLLDSAVEIDHTLSFRSFRFDPLSEDPALPFRSAGPEGSSGDFHLLQFLLPPTGSWLSELTDLGIEFLQYVPNQAFLVRASPSALRSASRHPMVRWTGEFPAACRVGPELMWVFENWRLLAPGQKPSYGAMGPSLYDVSVLKAASLESVRQAVVASGGTVVRETVLPANYFDVLRVVLPPLAIRAVASIPGVVAVDPYVPPQKEDEVAAQIVAGNYSGTSIVLPGYDPQSQFGVTGMNVTVGVTDDGIGIPGDGGFYITAANTVNGPLRGASAGASGHGHLQASIIAGSLPFGPLESNGFNFGIGVAPGAHLINVPFLRSGYAGGFAEIQNDVVSTAGPNGVRGTISNNSWGGPTNGNAYESSAAQHDGLAQDASFAATVDPVLIVFSAGNSGAAGLTLPKVAKNVIAVAASENVRPDRLAYAGFGTADSLEEIPTFSSRGLAADGRIKPDLTAPGDAITGGRSGSNPLFGNIDAYHRISSGTSHAAPHVAGAAALFAQFWKATHAGVNPSPALIKAALINGAVDMTGNGATAPRPNGSEGWGRVNMKNVLGTGVPTHYLDQAFAFADPGAEYLFGGAVANPASPVRVTLVWTDPPALADPALVNDLDLEVSVGGSTYLGNVLVNGLSQPGGSADTRNNVENVFLPAGVSGPIYVRVVARALNGNGILGNGDSTDQHFALVVVNAVPASLPLITVSSASLVTESCPPSNGTPDPGESVAIEVCLTNGGSSATSNLLAVIQPAGGVTSPLSVAPYGALAPGATVCQIASFRVDPAHVCGTPVDLTLALTDSGTSLGNVSRSLQTGSLSPLIEEGFDGVASPALPGGWSASLVQLPPTISPWQTVNSSFSSPPNSVYTASPAAVSDSRLDSPVVTVNSPSAVLTFRHRHGFEYFFDGGVLEISIGGGPFTDILSAGGSFFTGGYNGFVNSGFGNPLSGRQAWTGIRASFAPVSILLPASANGQSVQFRFRAGSDSANGGTGWYVDDVVLQGGYACRSNCPAPQPPTLTPAASQPIVRGAPPLQVLLGTVSDTDTLLANILVTASDLPPDLTLTNLALDPTTGDVTATVRAGCTAAEINPITLEVWDLLTAPVRRTLTVLATGPSATVSGGGSICAGTTSTVTVALTGTAPWTINWNDGLVQIAAATPASRQVSPTFSRTYSVTAVSDAVCASGTATGAATFDVRPLASATITAPAGVCESSTGNLASVPDGGPGVSYQWTISGGTITSATNTPSVVFTAESAGTGSRSARSSAPGAHAGQASASGTVVLTVTVTRDGCADTGTRSIPIQTPPLVPVPAIPANGSTYSGAFVSWTHPGGTSYDVFLDTVSPPEKLIFSGETSNFEALIPSWIPGVTYYWKVVARSACGTAASPLRSFIAGSCPWTGAAPAPTSPANGATGIGATATLTWAGVPGAAHYDVYFGTSAASLTRHDVADAPETSVFVPVSPGTTYYWKVVAVPVCGSSVAASSPAHSFTTGGTPSGATAFAPASFNRWEAGTVTLSGNGFTSGMQLFTDLHANEAGVLVPAVFTNSFSNPNQLQATLIGNPAAPAGRYDVGVVLGGLEKGRLLQAMALRAFTDVTEDDYYFLSSARMVDAGIMESDFSPATGPQFSPSTNVTRASMAEYLAKSYRYWRYRTTALPSATCTPSGAGSTTFPDVPCSHPNWLAIHWIKEWGVTSGVPCAQGTCFLPDATVNRAEMVTFIERLRQTGVLNTLLSTVGEKDPGCAAAHPACKGWTDAGGVMDVAGWPRREANLAFADRVTSGCSGSVGSDLKFCPYDAVTRGQIGEFLARTLGLVPMP